MLLLFSHSHHFCKLPPKFYKLHQLRGQGCKFLFKNVNIDLYIQSFCPDIKMSHCVHTFEQGN